MNLCGLKSLPKLILLCLGYFIALQINLAMTWNVCVIPYHVLIYATILFFCVLTSMFQTLSKVQFLPAPATNLLCKIVSDNFLSQLVTSPSRSNNIVAVTPHMRILPHTCMGLLTCPIRRTGDPHTYVWGKAVFFFVFKRNAVNQLLAIPEVRKFYVKFSP